MSSIFTLYFSAIVAITQPPSSDDQIMQAIESENWETAQQLTGEAYDAAKADRRLDDAGRYAYLGGQLARQEQDYDSAARHYKNCADRYADIDSTAQSVNCLAKMADALEGASRPARALSVYKQVARELGRLGQAQSAQAGLINLRIAQNLKAPLDRFARGRQARARHKEILSYLQDAGDAFRAGSATKTQPYLTTLMLEAEVLEILEDFDGAISTLEHAQVVGRGLPASEGFDPEAVELRIATVTTRARDDDNDKGRIVDAVATDGREITLTATRKLRVRYPRLKGNRIHYRGSASLLISLAPDGKVATAEVKRSLPDQSIGEAVKKAVETWSFTADDGTPADQIEPFEYTMVFYISPQP